MTTLRPRYHLTPPQGRLNDPNGMFLDGDTLHVFYQHDPVYPFAMKRTGWGHASASIHTLEWVHHPDALYPGHMIDTHGCYSGGAVRDEDGTVYLFYTGNQKFPDGTRGATQNIVEAKDFAGPLGGEYRRHPANPLIPAPEPGFTAHYRDPMVTRDPDGGWRMVLGAQREDETGAVVLYHSDDLFQWRFVGELIFDTSEAVSGSAPDLVPGGYMWECPNLVSLVDRATGETLEVLIICPQGLEPQEEGWLRHYWSSDQCGYLVGRLEGTTFQVLRGFSELDFGQQFYAPQITSEGIMVGWMGLPAQDDNPSVSAEGWVHCLTVPRRCSLVNGVLVQELVIPKQVREVTGSHVVVEDRTQPLVVRDVVTKAEYAWECVDGEGNRIVSLTYSGGLSPWVEMTVGNDTRRFSVVPGEVLIFIDNTAVEVSFGGGRQLAAAVSFPPCDSTHCCE